MRVTVSDIVSLYRPTPCDLRIYLREHDFPEAEPSAFDEILRTLGERHEQQHLATLGACEDISAIPAPDRVSRTIEAIQNHLRVIYQGEFALETDVAGIPVIVVGRPDYLIWDTDGYIIRDSKLSRQVDADHHVEITLQFQLYGWLFERTIGERAKRLQVHTGKRDIVDVPCDGGVAAILAELERVLRLKQLGAEPYEPVGWTKCGGCGFNKYCWDKAQESGDVALVAEVDQGLARQPTSSANPRRQMRATRTGVTLCGNQLKKT
jgi:predicted RecB family nuclease